MIENENNQPIKEKKDEINNSFFNFIKYSTKKYPDLYEDFSNNKKFISYYSQYSNTIIMNNLNENKIINENQFESKKNIRNIKYLIKTFKNIKTNLKYKKSKNSSQKIISQIFIAFNFNLFHEFLNVKKNNDIKKKNKDILLLNKLLNDVLFFIGKLYINKILSDTIFEFILKCLFIFSTTKSEKEPKEKGEIIHFIFFDNCIQLIKEVFNNLLLKQNEYTKDQENIINNILLYIKDNILINGNLNEIAYLNKNYLTRNQSKALLLIDLYFKISKGLSKKINNNIIDLLSNIYSFKYEAIMRPMMRQLEPLFINIKQKNIEQLKDEINKTDNLLSLINSLIYKEEKILAKHPCFLKQGFYFGNEISGLVCSSIFLSDEFTFILGFMVESNEEKEITLFNIITKDKKNKLRFYLSKNYNNNDSGNYGVFIEEKNTHEFTEITVNVGSFNIFSIHFKIRGIFQSSIMRINYVKDEIMENKEIDYEIKNKNIKNECNLYFGCEIDQTVNPNKIKNTFQGFIGDIIILNSKNIKNGGINVEEFLKTLLSLKGDYGDIISILGINNENNRYLNLNNNYYFNNEKIKNYDEKRSLIFSDIKTIISPNLFQLLGYQDDLDYMDLNNNINNQINIKKKYYDLKANSESSDEGMIQIYTNVFDKKFHIFRNNLTLKEFIKYDGINFLSLLFEYYYQICYHLSTIKNNCKKEDIKYFCSTINEMIGGILDLFYNIIKVKINSDYATINKFLYQMAITILKCAEFGPIDLAIIALIYNILESFVYKNEINDEIDNIKMYLFEFLLNPKLYEHEREEQLKKLKYVFSGLYSVIKIDISVNNHSQFIQKIYTIDILNKILSFNWLFDHNEKILKILIRDTEKVYSLLLKEYFISHEEKKKYLDNSNNIIQNELKNDIKTNDLGKNGGMKILEHYFSRILEYYNKNHYIFSKMCHLLVETNLIHLFEEARIIEINKIIFKELESNNDFDHKQLILKSCLEILYKFYFSSERNNKTNQEQNNNGDEDLHLFIKRINLSLDIFYALFSSLKIIKYFSSKEKNEIESKADNINQNQIIENNNILRININNEEGENDANNYHPLPFQKSDIELLKKLNEKQIHIIKTILEDIVYLLQKESNEKNKANLNQNNKKEMYEFFKKNFDFFFELKGTEIYQQIFSSETNICAEFFFSKWKIDNNEFNNDDKEIIKKYHEELLKNHLNPFIFKLYYYIFLEKKENYNTEIILMNNIVEILDNFQEELKNNKDNIYFIYNLLNVLVLLNEEIEKIIYLSQNNNINSINNIFKNYDFIGTIYKFIDLLKKSSLLYTNYYIETNNQYGKIICEIIYDFFFVIPDFDEKQFINAFIIEENEKVSTAFYLIDIINNKNLNKETFSEMKTLIPNCANLRVIYKKYFSKKNKNRIFLDKKLCQIEDVNFCIYIFAKSFIYLNEKNIIKERFEKKLLIKYLPILSFNIFTLYTRRNSLYGNKICKKFPLYKDTKYYFETFMVQNPENFNNYKEYFDNDMKVALKEEYSILFCYSSRLNDTKSIDIRSIISEKKEIYCNDDLNEKNINDNNNNLVKISRKRSLSFDAKVINHINADLNEYKIKDYIRNDDQPMKENSEYLSAFEIIKKENIYNPKNYFFKICFAEVYKNMIFNDKIFKLIKLAYLSTNRTYKNIHKDTKQNNFPIKQKNYCNLLEPKIFLRRDFSFYDENFLKISHEYLKNNHLYKERENIIFYPHKYKIQNLKRDLELFCELVTSQYVYFGKMYFFENFMFFETKEDPRDSDESIEIFMKYAISTKGKDNKNINEKSILIFNDEIIEIIERRTLFSYQSIEIFHKNGKSYFFNFFNTANIQKVFNYLHKINQSLLKNNFPKFTFFTYNNDDEALNNIINNFHNGKLSNYEYLLYLNKYATRTYNDSNQYPVFPWLIKEYNKIEDILTLLSKKDTTQDISNYFRDMKYPIGLQNDNIKNNAIQIFDYNEDLEFPYHSAIPYSSSAYIYYYLLRINPYTRNLIKLQENKFDIASRLFNNFTNTEKLTMGNADNREIIPDFFCYFDYYCNLNCSSFGKTQRKEIIEDMMILNNFNKDNSQYINNISIYANSLYNHKKLLNDIYISRILSQWVDIVFGKKQLPKKEERRESYNIFPVCFYEQNLNLNHIISDNYKKYNNSEITKEQFISEIDHTKHKLDTGMAVKQILKKTNTYEGKIKTIDIFYKENKANNDDIYIYCNRMNNDNLLLIKEDKKNKTKIRMAIIYNKNDKYFKDKESLIYDCKSMNLMKYRNAHKNTNNDYLYRVDYSFSYINLKKDNIKIPVFLSCRYLDNVFRIQCYDRIINIIYEDFVTCIKSRSRPEEDKEEDIFYTGLLNGKLTEWKIIPYIDDLNKIKTKKNTINCIYNFELKELKHVYAHQSSITAIEIYHNQNIIVTSGEDKFIYIRKIFDFELLTVIDLTYCFGNPIISQTSNIFPSLIKISDLNLLYVLLYDYDSKNTFIRGYNLNGLFFAQTDPEKFKKEKINFQFNSISFTKNSNLVVGFYNLNQFYVLKASNLTILWEKDLEKEIEKGKGKDKGKKGKDKNEKNGTKMIEYDYNNGEFYIVYENEFINMTLQTKDDIAKFDTF